MSLMDKITGNTEDTHAAVPMPDNIRKNERILILTADNTEDIEFFYPYYRLTEEGYSVDVVTPKGGKFEAKHGLGLKSTRSIEEVRAQDYALLYIPGGKAPAELRKNDKVLAFVKEFAALSRPIAAICHGPQVLISAGLAKGKRMAAWPEVESELKDAGAMFVNDALVEDGIFLTGRKPGDLPRHLAGVLKRLKADNSSASRAA